MSKPRYMLDTNIVFEFVRNPSGIVAARIAGLKDGELCVSIIVASELRFGCLKRGSAKLLERVETALSKLRIIPFDTPADWKYAGIRNALERSGSLIGSNDLLIAAHALALQIPLVTNNIAEFSRVPGLVIENWLEPAR